MATEYSWGRMSSMGPLPIQSREVLALPLSDSKFWNLSSQHLFHVLGLTSMSDIYNVKAEGERFCSILPTVGTDLYLPIPGLLKWEPAGPRRYHGTPCGENLFPHGWYRMTYQWYSAIYSVLAKSLSPQSNRFHGLPLNFLWVVCSSLNLLCQHPNGDWVNVYWNGKTLVFCVLLQVHP